MTDFAVSREPDDPIALRASIGGSPRIGYYLVFRGDPERVLAMLEAVTEEARRALPARDYADRGSSRRRARSGVDLAERAAKTKRATAQTRPSRVSVVSPMGTTFRWTVGGQVVVLRPTTGRFHPPTTLP